MKALLQTSVNQFMEAATLRLLQLLLHLPRLRLHSASASVLKGGVILEACPHLFPKQETLYPETGDFVVLFGNKIASFGIQSHLSVSGYQFAVSDNEVA